MINAQIPKDAVEVTPSDATELSGVGFYVGGAGNVEVVTEAGTATTFTCVAGGTIIVSVRKIMATGTTATAIVLFK